MKMHKKLIALISATILISSSLIGCVGNKSNSNKVINVFNCGDYIDEELITKFEEETGYKVEYSTYDTNEIMYSKIKSGSNKYDLVFPSDYMIEKMINEGMAEKINFDNIPNYKYIDEKFKNLSYDPNNEYSVPYMWGTIGIIYNPEIVKEEVKSWDILWDKKYDKEIIMFNSVRDTMAIALSKLGYSMNSTNPEEIKQAADILIEQKPIVKAWFVDQVKDAMINDEAALATVWSGDANYIISENPKLEYVVPEEGSNKWFDAMVIPKDAPNKEGAEAFINFLTDPENSLQNVDYIQYYTPNWKTYEMLDDEVKESYPTDETLDNCEVFKDLDRDSLKIYDDEWIRIGSTSTNNSTSPSLLGFLGMGLVLGIFILLILYLLKKFKK
ncbi:spermidine/putrescine ABC transporter substrate-binding protein [Clostridium paraputrificum]|uniref:Spermidine/putrescine ABC transporter substrate-binding protein n=2 Tax=Clostridiaceae TaxID=31979 RepID=A0A174ATH1_9CLOT|nr:MULTISPECIES: spermidine/putrescine ABC transporter substrate-binding protein [Clostridium]MDB2073834.1 spermidine/putrescine ABC transporter substrate-binding protein [Clostridium paraputrificum]MDB2080682.1 spermidine/putrescine ABC transporter substrate-binding protein [Clostridium paraputrificum]MDB2088963.1 spermidine/putrescine ABC transporter substrate-binding protein [Clostridium paraputrificum]MDB2095403.1 spermidine/putrescine ABC transporter substrate-binding protein [Clostridium 